MSEQTHICIANNVRTRSPKLVLKPRLAPPHQLRALPRHSRVLLEPPIARTPTRADVLHGLAAEVHLQRVRALLAEHDLAVALVLEPTLQHLFGEEITVAIEDAQALCTDAGRIVGLGAADLALGVEVVVLDCGGAVADNVLGVLPAAAFAC
jgi:hypothetical protein